VRGARILTDSLKSHKEWTSVWRAKCNEFTKKMKEFTCVWRWDFGGLAEITQRVDLSMENTSVEGPSGCQSVVCPISFDGGCAFRGNECDKPST